MSRFLCFLAGMVAVTTGFARAQDGVRVMTYNIRYLNTTDGDDVWPNRKDTVIETVRLADLVGLQECVAAQLEDIRKATPEFTWYGVGRDDGKLQGEMTAIGWRSEMFAVLDKGTFWLGEHPDEVGSKAWDAALPRIASWVRLQHVTNGKELLLVNTHFDHRGEIARKNSALQLRRWVAENRKEAPGILIGDLNATRDSEPLKALLEDSIPYVPVMRDAKELSPVADLGPDSTWNGFKEITPGQRIDHVLCVGAVTLLDFQTLNPQSPQGRFASDHLPVLATIRW